MLLIVWLRELEFIILTIRYDVTPQGLVKSQGNTVIFPGDKYPFSPKGFRVINDNAEGKALWEKARQDWIDRHPYVGRVDGDPPAKPFIQMLGTTVLVLCRRRFEGFVMLSQRRSIWPSQVRFFASLRMTLIIYLDTQH